MVKIEKNVPRPRFRNAKHQYPWDKMEIGDSFVVNGKTHAGVSSSASAAGIRRGMKFATSAIRDESGALTGEIRVWRIA